MIVYLFFYFFIGMMAFIFYKYMNIVLFIIGILTIVFFTAKFLSKNLAFLCILFFSVGFINNYIYYHIDVSNKVYEIRILENKKDGYLVECKGKKYMFFVQNIQYKNGLKLKVRGNCTYLPQYEKGIVGKLYVTQIINEDKDIIYKAYCFKERVRQELCKELGENNGNLISSVAFGYDDFMNKTQLEEFKVLGLVHVISVSGFHIALIYLVLEKILGIYGGLFISFLYTIFTGAEAATLRSFIMIFLMKISKKIYKKYNALNALNFTAIFILVIKPYYFLNIGFILSYLATLGIILFNKKLNKVLYRLPGFLRETLSLTLSAQIFVLPATICYFKTFNLGFILGNLIMLEFYTGMVIVGNLAILSYKIKVLWNCEIWILNKILYLHNIIMKVMLGITPQTIHMEYCYGIFLAVMIACFILYKKGYKIIKYIPIYLVVYILLYEYAFFASIETLNVKYGKAYVIYNGFERHLVTTLDPKFLKYKSYTKVSKLNKDFKVRIDGEYDILFIKDGILLKKRGVVIKKIETLNYVKIIGDNFIEIGELE